MKMTISLAAILATLTMTTGFANEYVHDTTGSSTQQDIKQIFSAANDLATYDDDEQPDRTQTFYAQWPNVLPGIVTNHDIPVVEGLSISGRNFLADTRQVHQVTVSGLPYTWRSVEENRNMTRDAINIDLFDDVRGLEVIDTNHFMSVRNYDQGSAAPVIEEVNSGIVGTAIDYVIYQANTANWNAARADGTSAAGVITTNTTLVNEVLNQRIVINRVLNELDEALPNIEAGVL